MFAAVGDSACSTPTESLAPPRKRKRDHDAVASAHSAPQSGRNSSQAVDTSAHASHDRGNEIAATSQYASNASIILVGMAGSGKSTLAVVGSLALNRRYVDFQDYFRKHTDSLPSQYINKHGMEEFRRMDLVVTRRLLAECSTNCIIGGLSGNELYAHGQLLREIGSTTPVIYIQRDVDELRRFASKNDGAFLERYEKRDNFYRSCSGFDYYNLEVDSRHKGSPTLKLKDVETDFVRFLRRILSLPNKFVHSATPLSNSYTYALVARSTWLESILNYEELECGADAISFIVDVSENNIDFSSRVAKQVALLRRHSRVPIILELDHQCRSGSTRPRILDIASRNLCDMVALHMDADMQAGEEISFPKHHAQIIASAELNMSWDRFFGSVEWIRLRRHAELLDCAAIRLSNNSSPPEDSLGSTALIRKEAHTCQMPLIAYETGESGRTTVCFNQTLSPVMPESCSTEGVTIKQAQIALHSCFIVPKQKFHIFGKSVSYSLSPAMHNAAYDRLGLPHEYDYIESSDFGDIHALFGEEDCRGVAVTLPYKSQVLPLLDHISDEARQIGAVNTVIIERYGASGTDSEGVVLHGHNTDHIGIRECIYRNISPANSIRSSSSVLIIGAGGMARAALYACRELGIKHGCVWNRTTENAETLVRSASWSSMELVVLNNEEVDWPSGQSQPTIIISTIPAHRLDHRPAHELNIPSQWLGSRTGGVFIELAYKPVVTRFIEQMQSMAPHGWVIADGLDVLLEQGIAQFELFTGRPAPVHTMRQTIREQYSRVSTPQRSLRTRRKV